MKGSKISKRKRRSSAAYRRPPKAPYEKDPDPELAGGARLGAVGVPGTGGLWGVKGRSGGGVTPCGGGGVLKTVPDLNSPRGVLNR
jgi:hypothetical protein